MIQDYGKMIVAPGVNYVSDWKDSNGNYEIEKYIPHGRYIINKVATGCGFTTYSLINNECTILVSPRLRLIRGKVKKLNKHDEICFYFNREIDQKTKKPLWDMDVLRNRFSVYYHSRVSHPNGIQPLKVLVTYDSFGSLLDMLTNEFGIHVNDTFRIVVDECHCIIKDVKMKENNNKPVLMHFLKRLFAFDNILFISATPIHHYFATIPEFVNNEVGYYEMVWSNIEQIIELPPQNCKNSLDAFDRIYRDWEKNTDANGTHVFDSIYLSPGCPVHSYEGVIFLNSVKDICKILAKYIGCGDIDPTDVTIICSETPENDKILKKVNSRLAICKDIPEKGEPHTTWTFVTRTSFEGDDFESSNASTFVIVNYNVKSLSLDIASDIPQIIGRQRLKDNLFRNSIHIYYTNNQQQVCLADFLQEQNEKREESMKRIANWQTAAYPAEFLSDLSESIEKNPNKFYLKTINGQPEIDELIPISERYCFDILLNHQQWFIIPGAVGNQNYSVPVETLMNLLPTVIGPKLMLDRIRMVFDFLMDTPDAFTETMFMLHNIGYNSVAYYFCNLPMERIYANGFDTWKMDNEIASRSNAGLCNLSMLVRSAFVPGQVYSKKDVKTTIQGIYDANDIKRIAKATDLRELRIVYQEAPINNGNKGVRIL